MSETKVNLTTLPVPENEDQFRELVLAQLIDHGAQLNATHRDINRLVAAEVEKALADKFILINDLIKEAQDILAKVKDG